MFDHFRKENASARAAFRGAIQATTPTAGRRRAARSRSKISNSSQYVARIACVCKTVAVPVDLEAQVPYVAIRPNSAISNHSKRHAMYSSEAPSGTSATTENAATGVTASAANAAK